ncbi:hypothetical protein SVAN01_10828 [Stagonosporopsis vannaccii]|nr:hypothetical protein SVAN01_10828 [Stagonosporopsis vannaccii]
MKFTLPSSPVAARILRRATNPPHDEKTIMNVVSWILLALVICTLVARFTVKLSRRTIRQVLKLDDIFLLLAALFSFGQTMAVSIQWRDVANQQLMGLPEDKRAVYQKAAYASHLLFIANMGCAKIAMAMVIRKLFSGCLFEYTSCILAIFTAGWTISGFIVTAFQCRLPTPWDLMRTSECVDIVAFGNYLASTNIMTEALLVLVPLAIWVKKTAVGNRLFVSAIFWLRLSVIAAIGTQLYFFNTSSITPSIAEDWATTLCIQIAQSLSVISACLPGLHPLVAKEMNDTASVNTKLSESGLHWDVKKFGALSSHKPQPSIDSDTTLEPVESLYCRPLATHGLVRSSTSCDSYNFPRLPSNIALPLSTLEPPVNVFNRLIRSSSSLELDPLGAPRNVDELGCLPAPDWNDEDEDEDSGRASPERRPTSDYVFQRSKVISVPEDRNMFEVGKEWNGFVPPLPTPRMLKNPPRAF